jgi:hypothetical protein
VLLRAGHLATAYAGPNTLPRCAAGPVRTWSDFDGDGDGQIDMITVIHSGYGAELGVSDADGMPGHSIASSECLARAPFLKLCGWLGCNSCRTLR